MRERKTSLRDFQARLSDRLREAAGGHDLRARLGLEIGGTRWLVDLGEAGEIVPMPSSIVPVPLTARWFRGLVNLRGALYGVTDLAEFAGSAPTVPGKEARLLAFSRRLPINAAIMVTRMLGLRNVDDLTPVDGDDEGVDWAGRSWRDASGAIWRELRLSALCADVRFQTVGR